MQILYAEKVETQENCLENLQSVAFSSNFSEFFQRGRTMR